MTNILVVAQMDSVTLMVDILAAVLGAKSADEVSHLLKKQPEVAETAKRLVENQPEVAETAKRLVESEEQTAAKQLVTWAGAAVGGLPLRSPPILENVPLKKSDEVAAAIEVTTTTPSPEPGQLLVKTGKGDNVTFELLVPEQRIGFGLTRASGEEECAPLLLLATEEAIPKDYRAKTDSFEYRVVGFASADLPGAVLTRADAEILPHRPGRSVAHNQGTAGSLGLYVTYTDKDTKNRFIGFTSASHVLSNFIQINRTNIGDIILSPGAPPR
jgi:hypothetical protein